jgi:hypothetical protein
MLQSCRDVAMSDNRAQIEKLLASRSLQGSDSLRKLLQYLAHQSSSHPGASPKEYQIATEVFGRHEDFDPHLDSLVRVQAARLRTKLAEYYASEGSADPVVVELPKGTYGLKFREREAAQAVVPAEPPAATVAPREHERVAVAAAIPRWAIALVVVAMFLAGALGVAVDRLLLRHDTENRVSAASVPVATSLRAFWNGFLGSHEQPLVVFSNAPFVGRPDTGMRYYDAEHDGNATTLDHYTGVGEVLAVHALDGVFAELHKQLRVKRGSLFTLDDAKNNDLIFIGSPSENLTLRELPNTKEFVFRKLDCCFRKGNVEIVNLHPGPGEAKEFLASPQNETMTEDYSLIAIEPGLEASYQVLILAGTTTMGTQAAVEYVSQQNSLDELTKALGVSTAGQLKPFEAVIHVKVVRGVPVSSELVVIHKASS